MTPIQYYKNQCQAGVIVEDHEQLQVLEELQKIHHNLLIEHQKRNTIFAYFRKPKLIQGLYLWGSVGIGKTFLMDCFFNSIPFSQKLRIHFHAFMQRVHQSLTKHQGEKDPLLIIANEIAKETMVLCFDEFFVLDITDAMLLGRLLKALFAKGVSLILTSNAAPDELYKNGLQREQFLPAIAMLKKFTKVIHLPSTKDYRLRYLKEAGVFYTPLDANADHNMQKTFELLSEGEKYFDEPIMIQDRLIPTVKHTTKIVWFEFMDICHLGRSQLDYLDIAKKYKIVFISHIPIIAANEKDIICLFINLVDVMYDARIKLVMSAAESIPNLYSRGYKILEFARTHSRLIEMQSLDYFFDDEEY